MALLFTINLLVCLLIFFCFVVFFSGVKAVRTLSPFFSLSFFSFFVCFFLSRVSTFFRCVLSSVA